MRKLARALERARRIIRKNKVHSDDDSDETGANGPIAASTLEAPPPPASLEMRGIVIG